MRHAFLTVDLGFGDAGKGSIVDFLCRTYAAHTVVRYNGGAQAAHRVVTPAPHSVEHVFSQFGSGVFAGAATHLSRFMLLEPAAMIAEEQHLRTLGVTDAFQRTTIDEGALVITPFQRAVNRLKELARGDGRHGSCGMGIGETMADYMQYGRRVLFVSDLADPQTLWNKLRFLHAVNLAKAQVLLPDLPANDAVAAEQTLLADDWDGWLLDIYAEFVRQAQITPSGYLQTLFQQPGVVIFEGAQGALLDEWYGFHPYTTWSTTTLENAYSLLAEAGYNGQLTRIGITRAYATRHGAGPLVSEDTALTAALPDPCNGFGLWQQDFRVGWLDLVMLRYALELVGALDYLAVTCLDRLVELPVLQVCRRYCSGAAVIERLQRSPIPCSLEYQAQLTADLANCTPVYDCVADPMALLGILAAELGTPVGLISTGPTAADKCLMDMDIASR